MTLTDEPTLDISDIQGHIFPGFGSKYSVVAGFRLVDHWGGRTAVSTLIPEVTTMAYALQERDARKASLSAGLSLPEQDTALLALSFSSSALRDWGFGETGFDESFRQGMLNDLRSLGDPVDAAGAPLDWQFGDKGETRIDLLLVGGHSAPDALEENFVRWLKLLSPYWELIHEDRARRRTDDKEFFGFNDGISQPAIRGRRPDGTALSTRYISETDDRAKVFAKPGQRLVWPGNFIFGYEREVSGSTKPGSVFEPAQAWMKNGSYLVYRRLNQDTEAFTTALEDLQTHFQEQGMDLKKNWLGSRLVGRWEDGAPVIIAPDAPDDEIGGDSFRNNNFQYQFNEAPVTVTDHSGNPREIPQTLSDARGTVVPKASHIRQINPRAGQSDRGAEVHPLKLMLRRGVTFGAEVAEDPDAERGLIFLSYQTSIVNQFLFLQSTWANSANAPGSVGRDPLIGQDGTQNPRRTIKIPDMTGRLQACPFHGRWVVPTSGGYFFTPGIEGLREISRDLLIASVESGPGELDRIKGIGPVYLEKLAELGITRFEHLAMMTERDTKPLEGKFGTRLRREDWIAQAVEILRTRNV